MKHIAIIMDGNRRWEKEKQKKQYDGYKKGAEIIIPIVDEAIALDLKYLSIYAFSSENWQRPIKDIAILMKIAIKWFDENLENMHERRVRCRIIGNRDLLPSGFLQKAEIIEDATKHYSAFNLQIAISYGARDEMLRAFLKINKLILQNKDFNLTEENFSSFLDTKDIPDPDLLIRTGGEQRLSNYMLWQMAYTEFQFIDTFWPDFKPSDLKAAVDKFKKTDRRFGVL
jgi:undecaprenyl diphosphate synthase